MQDEGSPVGEEQAEAPVSDGKRTPDEWRDEFFPRSEKGSFHPDAWKHGAAEAFHGWKLHELHANAPIRLTRDDYQAAVKAVEGNTNKPHPGALSEYLKINSPSEKESG